MLPLMGFAFQACSKASDWIYQPLCREHDDEEDPHCDNFPDEFYSAGEDHLYPGLLEGVH